MPRYIELTGTALRNYLRALVLAEDGASAALAERVSRRAAANIGRMLVMRNAQWSRHRHCRRLLASAASAKTGPDERPPSHSEPPPFDPFAFAVEALLIKQGEEALAQRLALIAATADLRALAKAQRVPVDPALGADADAAALRDAIVRGACKRLADRRAAAG